MYLGQAEVGQDDLNTFMNVAAKFHIRGLSNEEKVNELKVRPEVLEEQTEQKIEHVENIDVPLDSNDEGFILIDPLNEDKREDVDNSVYNGNLKEIIGFPNNKKLKNEYDCGKCEYKAKQMSHIRAHIKSKHEGVRFACEYCDYSAGYSHNLNQQKRMKHTM